jgi:hypothetical protein
MVVAENHRVCDENDVTFNAPISVDLRRAIGKWA